MQLLTPQYGRIEYKELKGSPHEAYVGHQGKAVRKFRVAWPSRWKFLQTFIGYSWVNLAGTASAHIIRVPPQAHPVTVDVPGQGSFDQPWLYAQDVESIEGMEPDPVGFPQLDDEDTPYKNAAVTVAYESLTFRVLDDEAMKDNSYTHDGTPTGRPEDFAGGRPRRYLTKVIQPTAEYLKMSFGVFVFVANDPVTGKKWQPASLGQGKIIPAAEVLYQWHQFPTYKTTVADEATRVYYPPAVKTHLGTVNDAEFDGYNKGTLLFTAFEYKPYRMIGGHVSGDLVYKMKHFEPNSLTGSISNTTGHNYFIRPDVRNTNPFTRLPLQWTRAASRLDGSETSPEYPPDNTDDVYLYNYRDFKKLFQVTT